MISDIKQVTIESVLERTNFLLILKTASRLKAFRSREVLAVNLNQAIASAEVNLEDVLEAYILIGGS